MERKEEFTRDDGQGDVEGTALSGETREVLTILTTEMGTIGDRINHLLDLLSEDYILVKKVPESPYKYLGTDTEAKNVTSD
jgi:hypothetical protein